MHVDTPNDKSSATRPTGCVGCNRSALSAGFSRKNLRSEWWIRNLSGLGEHASRESASPSTQEKHSLFRSAGSRSKSIQPSLKPSSICRRESILHPLRHEQFLPRLAGHHFHAHWSSKSTAKMAAISLGVRRCGNSGFHHRRPGPVFLKQPGSHPANVRSHCRRGHRLVSGLHEKLGITPCARRSHVQAAVLHEPCGPQKSNQA